MLKLACDIITFGLLVWVCYNTVVLIRDGWRYYKDITSILGFNGRFEAVPLGQR